MLTDVAADVHNLRQQAGKDIVVMGSAELAQTLMRHELVDENRLMLHPVTLGQASGFPRRCRHARPRTHRRDHHDQRSRHAHLPTHQRGGLAMERVTGIGGFFFRARDPDALNRWYAKHLGVVAPTGRYADPGWFTDRGETVFTAFAPDSDAFGTPDKTWKINFRVRNLDRMIDQLLAAGVEVHLHDREYPNGRFAELADPEGNRIQLWEPNAASMSRDPGQGRSSVAET